MVVHVLDADRVDEGGFDPKPLGCLQGRRGEDEFEVAGSNVTGGGEGEQGAGRRRDGRNGEQGLGRLQEARVDGVICGERREGDGLAEAVGDRVVRNPGRPREAFVGGEALPGLERAVRRALTAMAAGDVTLMGIVPLRTYGPPLL